jgi:glycosyltransferase involved in cell wall biosynthesis
MTRRRLTHVVESLEPWGTQRLLSLVARRLPSLDRPLRRDYEQRVVAIRSMKTADVSCRAELESAGVSVDVIGRPDSNDDSLLRTMWKLRPYLRDDTIDFVHLWDDAAIAAAVPWIARLPSNPITLCSIREPRRESSWGTRLIELRTLLRSIPIVNDATVYRQRIAGLKLYEKHWATAVETVPHDPIDSHATRTVAEVRSALGVPATTRLIGTACRLTHDKNVRDLLFAGALLKLVHSDFRIVIVGEGPALNDLRRFAELMRIDDLTIFTGLSMEPDDVISALFAYVAPSYWTGRAREIAIALGLGIPIVAVDTPIHREEFDVDKNGFVFGEHDQGMLTRHLHHLMVDESLYARMASAARERAERSPDPDDVVQRYADVYETIEMMFG